ncbi:hypothetical protein CRG98_025679 [Punica granatum]|uniref:Uncharacterized protein n=1 Tax=Punica granatum TaxID=22663 RepID=A0A2I0JCD3_PUNGR|nr:hypothetical protein CRG98_025679 [Punica granatum]
MTRQQRTEERPVAIKLGSSWRGGKPEAAKGVEAAVVAQQRLSELEEGVNDSTGSCNYGKRTTLDGLEELRGGDNSGRSTDKGEEMEHDDGSIGQMKERRRSSKGSSRT